MGDVKKVGKIEIEDKEREKTNKHDRTPRGTKGRPQASRIGLPFVPLVVRSLFI